MAIKTFYYTESQCQNFVPDGIDVEFVDNEKIRLNITISDKDTCEHFRLLSPMDFVCDYVINDLRNGEYVDSFFDKNELGQNCLVFKFFVEEKENE